MFITSLTLGSNWKADEWPDSIIVCHDFVHVDKETKLYVQERTCYNYSFYMDNSRFVCSSCGYNGWAKDSATGEDFVPLFCPHCGSKVINKN